MAIQIQGVSKSFVSATGEDIQVLAEVSMQIKKQEFFSIVGPSGCGKSTIFNIIAGLLKPTNGKVIVCGEEIDQTTGHVGYMMQKDLLLPWRSILDNVTLGLEVKGMSKKIVATLPWIIWTVMAWLHSQEPIPPPYQAVCANV